jgi:hypothetical protein
MGEQISLPCMIFHQDKLAKGHRNTAVFIDCKMKNKLLPIMKDNDKIGVFFLAKYGNRVFPSKMLKMIFPGKIYRTQ